MGSFHPPEAGRSEERGGHPTPAPGSQNKQIGADLVAVINKGVCGIAIEVDSHNGAGGVEHWLSALPDLPTSCFCDVGGVDGDFAWQMEYGSCEVGDVDDVELSPPPPGFFTSSL